MHEPLRIAPEAIYPKIRSGETLLVCAYADDAKFQRHRLAGAISLEEFRALLPGLSRDREIVFYCA